MLGILIMLALGYVVYHVLEAKGNPDTITYKELPNTGYRAIKKVHNTIKERRNHE